MDWARQAQKRLRCLELKSKARVVLHCELYPMLDSLGKNPLKLLLVVIERAQFLFTKKGQVN